MKESRVVIPRGRRFMFLFFLTVILAGTALLGLPFAWRGPHPGMVDCLFIACSAVSVTGLATVNVATLSPFGQVVLLLLIQTGGLGIISITTLILLGGASRMSLGGGRLVGEYYLPDLEFRPRRILSKILGYTFSFEILGTLVMWPWIIVTRKTDALHAFFQALFHAVSAFCNAGFSLYPDGLNGFSGVPGVYLPVMVLFVAGGLGFVVIDDIRRFSSGKRHHLSLHSTIMITATLILLLGGALLMALLEWNGALAAGSDPSVAGRLGNALFSAATPRTAGFDTIPPAAMGTPARVLVMVLMFIGGGSGSTAGGLKVGTAFILFLLLVRGIEEGGDLRMGHRRIKDTMVSRAMVLFSRMAGMLLISFFLLCVAEALSGHGATPMGDLAFETVSAFSTVGLSTGITPGLGTAGKLVLIVTMLAGRLGVTALAMPRIRRRAEEKWTAPKEDILL